MSALPKFSDAEVRAARRMVRNKYKRPDRYTVTPEDAQILIASSKGNRIINDNRLALLTTHVEKGTFYYNGESAIIDDDSSLRDGHHRLLACIKGGKPIDLLLVPSVPAVTHDGVDVQLTMDDGANRTNTQAFSMTGVPNASLAATAVKAIMTNGTDGYKTSSPKISSPDLISYYGVYSDEIQSVVRLAKRLIAAVKIPSPPVAVFLFQARANTSDDLVDLFVREFSDTSTGGAIGDGRIQLMRLTGGGESGTRDPAYRLLRFTFDAWQRGLKKVKTSTDKPLPKWNSGL